MNYSARKEGNNDWARVSGFLKAQEKAQKQALKLQAKAQKTQRSTRKELTADEVMADYDKWLKVQEAQSFLDSRTPTNNSAESIMADYDNWLAGLKAQEAQKAQKQAVPVKKEQKQEQKQIPVLQDNRVFNEQDARKRQEEQEKIVADKDKKKYYGEGNINLRNRPQYVQKDGSLSTVNSISINDNGKEVLIPTIAYDGAGRPTQLTDDQAIQRYYDTGEHLGKFNSIEEANKYAEKLHEEQAEIYKGYGKQEPVKNEKKTARNANDAEAMIRELAEKNNIPVSEARKQYAEITGQSLMGAKEDFAKKGITATEEANIDKWIDPNYKMTKNERKAAQKIVKAFNKKYGSQGQLIRTDEEKAEAAKIAALDAKSKVGGSFNAGFYRPILNASNMLYKGADYLLGGSAELGAGMIDDLAGTDLAGAVHNARESANDQMAQNAQYLRGVYQNAQTQNPLAYGGGNLAGTAAMYMATNPAFDAIGSAAGLGAGGQFLANQVGQNAQDLLLDTLPEYMENTASGMSTEEANKEALKNIGMNAGGNLLMGMLAELIPVLKSQKEAQKKAADEIVQYGRDVLAPLADDADNVARTADIASLAKQTQEIPNPLDPATMAKQAAEGVDDIAAQSKQAADAIENLSEQVPKQDILSELNPTKPAEAAQEVAEQVGSGRARIVDNALNGRKPSDTDSRVMGNMFAVIEQEVRDGKLNLSEDELTDILGAMNKYARTGDKGALVPVDEILLKAGAEEVPMQTARIGADPMIAESLDRFDIMANNIREIMGRLDYAGNAKAEKEAGIIEQALQDYEKAINAKDVEAADEASRVLTNARRRFHNAVKNLEGYNGELNTASMGTAIDTPAFQMRKNVGYKSDFELTDVPEGDRFAHPKGTTWDEYQAAHKAVQDRYDAAGVITDEIEKRLPNTPEAADKYEQFVRAVRNMAVEDTPEAKEALQKAYKEIEGALTEPLPEETVGDAARLLDMDLQFFAGKADDAAKAVNPEDIVKPVEPAGTGNVPKAPDADIELPEGQKERSFAKNVRTQRVEDVPDEVAAEFSDQPEIYNVLHNADTKDKAQKIFDQGMDSARNQFDQMLTAHDPAAIPLGHSIAKELSAQGNHDAAAEVLRRMSQELTKTGQFSQAAAITMMKDDPMTALSYIQKQMDALNREGLEKFGKKWKDFSLTDAEKEMFDKIEPGDSEAIERAFDEIGKRIGIEYPSTMMDKLLEARKVAMLFNVRTNVRNLLANMPTLGMRWTADRVEAVGQNIAHLINPNVKVTQSLTGSGREGRKLAQKVFDSDRVKALLNGTSGKYEVPSLKSTITKNATMFKGSPVAHWIDDMTDGGIQKLNKALFDKEGVRSGAETIRNATYKMLDLGDSPFVRENFVQRLGSYIKAQGIKNIEDVPDEAIQVAWEEAMKATYKDNSWAVQMLRGIRNDGIGRIPVIGRPLSQAAIPFLQAPGNIAARMVDYSPIRGTKGIADIIKGARGSDEKLIRRGIEEASKGLTGTGMLLLGMALHKEGILTGALSDDKDKAQFEKQTGKRAFALHVGDKYLTYDWAQPFAEPLLVGTLLGEAIKASDDYDSDLLKALGYEGTKAGKVIGGLKAGTSAAVNSWFDASPLQGLQELMGGGSYSTGGIAENIGKVGVSNFLQSFVPAAVGATAKSLDPTQRQTYDPSNQIATQINLVKSKIPGLSKTLPAKYDTWGREVKTGESPAEAFAARFLIPGDYAYDKESPIDQEINRLYESLEGNNVQMFPQVAANKVGDKKLNNREISAFQKDMGERSYKLAESFIQSDAYKSMDDESKVTALAKLYGVSKAISERDLFDKPVADTYKKLVDAYDKNGEKGVIEYMVAKEAAKNENGNVTVQSVLDYAKANKDVSKDTLEMMMPSNASGTLAKVNGQWVYKDKDGKVTKQASDAPAEKTKTELKDYGITKNGAISSVEKAQTVIPGLTQNEAVNTYKKIDANGNQGITQDELISYLNRNNMSESEGRKYWNAYGSSTWKKVPVLANGTWKKK